MALKTIGRINIAEQAFNQLKEQILGGIWKEGDRLPSELELTEALGVSRTTIRQAIRTLVDYGLVETRNGAGTYVKRQISGSYMLNIVPLTDLQTEDMVEILDFLCLIEDNVAAMAAERCTEADVAALRELQERIKSAKGDLGALTEYDLQFHIMIAKITQNSLAIQTYSLLSEFLETAMYRAYTRLGAEEGVPYHEELLRAFAGHDAELARQIMGAHVRNRRAKFIASLQTGAEAP
ncbi:FadR/GntR family transcriptional regulator [uncultured Oscillibacter sp.]|uniref:FadR/GntR family transcriptional regulator n=1 Tax=uncultured Oscillibacter sp. TaxID=876091 RepID=UPI0025D74A14|nr:FadR/GntR family transcriptional regulator [uncultured Oscillibacter sp.]